VQFMPAKPVVGHVDARRCKSTRPRGRPGAARRPEGRYSREVGEVANDGTSPLWRG